MFILILVPTKNPQSSSSSALANVSGSHAFQCSYVCLGSFAVEEVDFAGVLGVGAMVNALLVHTVFVAVANASSKV